MRSLLIELTAIYVEAESRNVISKNIHSEAYE